jgi:hypothetical protein
MTSIHTPPRASVASDSPRLFQAKNDPPPVDNQCGTRSARGERKPARIDSVPFLEA